jgi:heme/copper-type cytochrome/quinol oxidase subunit 2
LAAVLFTVLGALTSEVAEFAPFVLIFFIPSILGIVLPWFVGRWAVIVPVVLALALLALLAPMLPYALAHPEAGLEFVAITWLAFGALVGVIGGVASVMQWRRRTARPGATRAQRLALAILLTLPALLAVIGFGSWLVARTTLTPAERGDAVSMTMRDSAYALPELQAQAGATVRLAVANQDAGAHTFTLPEAGVDVFIPPGAERLVEFQAPAAGTYTWYCIPHVTQTETGPEGMTGTLRVGP